MNHKILFVCGTFELAKSGVADYINFLACELTRQEIHCACIAINDPYVSPAAPGSPLGWERNFIPVRRLSSLLPWSERTERLNADLDSLNPDWISLHYVPYAFHPKGLSLGLLKCVKAVKTTAQWQIMAHELWVDPNASLRNRLLSTLQQLISRRIFSTLRPHEVHVTNHLYQTILSDCGIQANILPLFSSIPFSPCIARLDQPSSQWTFILFGSINRDWKPEPLLRQIESARQLHEIKLCRFVSVGNIGEYGALLWDSLASSSYPAFTFSRLGELPAALVSEQLQNANFGIAVVPSALVGKSSSVAAMISHGLPVIISRLTPNSEQLHQLLVSSGHYLLLDSSFASALGSASKYPPGNNLADIAGQFIRDLNLAT